ncbi:MAG TPA: DUF642 domain-containing protein [Phycisphaerales bacterium]|nr:DUF642 domain-containing protein [Phycisphaerales bacterium]
MRLIAAVCLCVCAAGSASASIINGGFELPGTGFQSVSPGQTFGGWTCAGPNGIEFVHATPNAQLPGLEFSAYEGSYWIDLTGVGAPSGIYQDVTTAANTLYEVTFAMAGNVWSGPQVMNLNVLWNDALAGSFSHSTAGRSGADMGWTLHSVTVLGTGLDRLRFQGLSGAAAAGVAIDAVSIRVVPAPAGVAGLAMGCLMASRRRRA